MRLFIAIDVPEHVKEHLAFLQQSLPSNGIRLVHPKNIHLTLNFLGEMDSAEPVIRQLRDVKFLPFTLRLSTMGFFPSRDIPRVFWVGLEDSEQLLSLQEQIDTFFKPDKSFKAHLTLGRIKKLTEKEKLHVVHELDQAKVKPLAIKVTSFKLYKSTLTSLGPIYEALETFEATV